ncbi:MAG: GIY-YIG nuclease family protein [Oscillatoriales cyanobacterium]|nr:MAG: GIY-YIG nuclease family protein [Oscillatoriales cyanobacterium]
MKKQQNHAVPGYVYLIYDPSAQLHKIGLSRSPATRLRYLKQSYGGQLRILQVVWTFNMLFVEQSLHKQFKLARTYRGRMDGGTEWFELNWWQIPVAKTSLMGKALGVNLSYIGFGLILLALVSKIIFG